jgi:hypothetical protein
MISVSGTGHVGKISLIHATGTTVLMNTERWQAVFNMHTFLGDTISRKMAYYFKPLPVMVYLLVTGLGAVLALLKIPVLFWTGERGRLPVYSHKYIERQTPPCAGVRHRVCI